MFKEIHIQNFRGIKDLKINDFKQVNLFVGANNSGKTSVLEALYISLNPNNADLLTVTNLQRGFYNSRIEKGTESIVVEKLFSDGFKYLFYKLLYKKQIEIETKFNISGKELTQNLFINSIIESNSNPLSGMSSTGASTQEKLSGLTQEFHIKEPGKKKKIYTSKSLYESKINAPQGSPDDSFQQLINGSLISSKPPNISSIESLVSQVIDNVQKNEVLEIIKNLDLSINSFDLTEGGIVKFNLGLGQLMPIGSLGDGVARAFFIACHAAGEKAVQNGILLIDEIENGLHYSSQDKLWKWLFKVAKEKNIQIFATTHSEDCEKSFIKASKEFVDSLEKKSTTNSKNKTRKEDLDPSRLYRLEKKLDHTFRVEPYDYKSLDVSINDLGVETR